MHWEAELIGEKADLVQLAGTFTGPELSIVARQQEYVLSSTEFETLTSARAVRDQAKLFVTALSGFARLELGSHVGIEVGSVYRIHYDGKRDVTVFPEPAVIRVRLFPPTVTITKADGTSEVQRPANRLAAWLPIATADPLVSKALRLRNKDELKWVELYRIYEVIESDVGSTQMIDLGWATKRELERFTRTANSAAAAGDDARHGRERTQPPPSPLSLSHARALIDSILRRWLEWKVRSRGT